MSKSLNNKLLIISNSFKYIWKLKILLFHSHIKPLIDNKTNMRNQKKT